MKRCRGTRGTEGLEVDFKVTRAHVETSPLWRFLNFGIEYFQQKKHFVWFRVVSWMEEFRNLGFRGAEVLEGLEVFFTSLHY